MFTKLKLEGAFTALVTPFTESGEVDYDQLAKNCEHQIACGINGLVPAGTTGECPTITHDEHDKVIETVVKASAGRVPVIAGTGSNSTVEAVRLTQRAKESGVDACLVVNPYYNKPNQAGLTKHFKAIAAVGLPIVLYNIPGRTGITMTPQTVKELYEEVPEIVAIKEATGSLDQASEIRALCDIQILSGDDSLTLPLMSVGGCGVISVLSNLSVKSVTAITGAALSGDFHAARQAHIKAFALMRIMFLEVNPQPIKEAMLIAGKMPCAELRLPLVRVSEASAKKIKESLDAYGDL